MDDPNLFAGRFPQVLTLVQSLHTQGACPVIYGDRGLGKSSLALQAEWIASGDTQLLHQYNLLDWVFDEHDYMIPIYVTCSSSETPNTNAILQRAINHILGMTQDPDRRTSRTFAERTTRTKLSLLKMFEAEQTMRYIPDIPTDNQSSLGGEEMLMEIVDKVAERLGHPVLIIVDELDQVGTTAGLSSFIKSASSPNMRFLLVGIAETYTDLLADHKSIERSCVPIRIPPMDERELRLIIQRAEDYLGRMQGVDLQLSFTDEAKRWLAQLSEGYPWFVHLLGQSAVTGALARGSRAVESFDISYAARDLTSNRFAQQFSDSYHTAVKGSRQREIVLRTFACWDGVNIPLQRVYRILRDDLAISSPGYYKRQLCGAKHGCILGAPSFPDSSVARFSSEMFKVYARLCPSIHPGIDVLVDEACKHELQIVTSPAELRGRSGSTFATEPPV